MVKVDAFKLQTYYWYNNKYRNSKTSSHLNFTPPQWKTIYHITKYLQYLLCFASQKRSWRHFVWDYVKRIHDTIQGFPCQKKNTKFYLSEIHKKQDFKSTVQVSNCIVFVFVTKKDKCIPNRYWFCLFDKGLNIW